MSSTATRTERYLQVESTLALLFVLFKANVLRLTWGKIQGFDGPSWMEVFHATNWFEPFTPARIWLASYHPPLSYLLGKLIYAVYPHEVEASQMLSTLAVVVAFFSVRQLLRRIGWLWTLPGLWLLYGGFSIPVIVWIGIETTYDAWVLGFFMLAFALSVGLFWEQPVGLRWWKHNRTARGVTWLGLVFALGLLNKYTGLLSFCLPFFVIFARRGFKATFRESVAPSAAILIAVVTVFPFYYEHYYKVEHSWTPASMDWQRAEDLVKARAKRDEHPVAFMAKMLRYPEEVPENPQRPVPYSFVQSTWLHTWFLDVVLGRESEPALTISGKYSNWFAKALALGSAWFLIRRRHLDQEWRALGWILLSLATLFSCFGLYFGWKFPLWDWRVFKTKYMTPAVFWLPYAVSIGFSDSWVIARRHTRWVRWSEDLAFGVLVAFVAINHLLPVY